MPTLQIAGAKSAGAVAGAGSTLVMHSRHYHAALLRTLYEAEGVDGGEILREAARIGAGGMSPAASQDGRAALTELLRTAGLGLVEEASLRPDGTGEIRLRDSHFAAAWSERFAPAAAPVCAATAGILSSALSRHYHRPLEVVEADCVAQGRATCRFSVQAGHAEHADGQTGARDRPVVAPELRNLAEDGALIDDLFGGMFEADAAGVIVGPGGPFTRLPAALYAAVAFGFEREVPRRRGAKFGNLPGILLQEAAHRNGFHLFGEILRSGAWLERVEPGLATAEERLRMLLRLVAALGWGSWEVKSFAAGERLIVQIPDSYEAAAHAWLFGRAGSPRCCVARGAAAAIMNLLFRADAMHGSVLTDSDYNQMFRSPASFRALETRCRGMGDAVCEIVVNPLSL